MDGDGVELGLQSRTQSVCPFFFFFCGHIAETCLSIW